MQCIEPVIEDLYVEETTSHPEVYERCKRLNTIIGTIEKEEKNEKIGQENALELKRISREQASLCGQLRKLIIDKAIYQRTDVSSKFGFRMRRRKSIEFEDVDLSTKEKVEEKEKSSSSNLTAFIHYGRAKTDLVKSDLIKKASSEQKLETLADLKKLQFWEGEPDAINSVRRPLKPRAVQLEQLMFCRSRKFDKKNEAKNDSQKRLSSLEKRSFTSLGVFRRLPSINK